MDKKLFLLDGMALVYRAHFALITRPIFTSKGVNTSALYGFTQTLLEILKKQEPTHIAVAFDTEAPTQRHKEFADYKATREVTPDKDFGQLIDENTFLYKPGRMGNEVEILGLPEIQKRWGVERPEQVVDV